MSVVLYHYTAGYNIRRRRRRVVARLAYRAPAARGDICRSSSTTSVATAGRRTPIQTSQSLFRPPRAACRQTPHRSRLSLQWLWYITPWLSMWPWSLIVEPKINYWHSHGTPNSWIKSLILKPVNWVWFKRHNETLSLSYHISAVYTHCSSRLLQYLSQVIASTYSVSTFLNNVNETKTRTSHPCNVTCVHAVGKMFMCLPLSDVHTPLDHFSIATPVPKLNWYAAYLFNACCAPYRLTNWQEVLLQL